MPIQGGIPNSSIKLNLISFLWRVVGQEMKRERCLRKAMTHLPVQTWTEPSATQISLTGNKRERRTGNLKCAVYDVQGVSRRLSGTADKLGLAVLRLEDDVVLEICDKTN